MWIFCETGSCGKSLYSQAVLFISTHTYQFSSLLQNDLLLSDSNLIWGELIFSLCPGAILASYCSCSTAMRKYILPRPLTILHWHLASANCCRTHQYCSTHNQTFSEENTNKLLVSELALTSIFHSGKTMHCTLTSLLGRWKLSRVHWARKAPFYNTACKFLRLRTFIAFVILLVGTAFIPLSFAVWLQCSHRFPLSFSNRKAVLSL